MKYTKYVYHFSRLYAPKVSDVTIVVEELSGYSTRIFNDIKQNVCITHRRFAGFCKYTVSQPVRIVIDFGGAYAKTYCNTKHIKKFHRHKIIIKWADVGCRACVVAEWLLCENGENRRNW